MNLVDGFKPLLCLSRAFGMAPYGFDKAGIKLSVSCTVYSCFFFLVNLTCQCTFVYYILSNGSLGLIQGFIESLDSLTFAINCIGCTFLILLRRKIILDNIQKLNDFCSNTQFLSPCRMLLLKKMGLTMSAFSFCFSIVFSITDLIVWSKNMIQIATDVKYYFFLCGFLRIIISYLTCCHFVFYFTIIRFMHTSVNSRLVELRNTYKRDPNAEVKGIVLKGFRFLIKTDGWIKDLTEQWFISFSIYAVCICAVVLFEVVYTTVFYYMTSVSIMELVASLIWILYFLSQFFVLIIVSDLSTKEVGNCRVKSTLYLLLFCGLMMSQNHEGFRACFRLVYLLLSLVTFPSPFFCKKHLITLNYPFTLLFSTLSN